MVTKERGKMTREESALTNKWKTLAYTRGLPLLLLDVGLPLVELLGEDPWGKSLCGTLQEKMTIAPSYSTCRRMELYRPTSLVYRYHFPLQFL